MATLTQDNIKKGVINGTNQKDVIVIDGNNVSSKKLTIKAGNGDDEINAKNFDGTLYVYAGMGRDIIYASQGNNYLYGESGVNTFVVNPSRNNTVISVGKGAAIIDFTNVEFVDDKFFSGKFVDDNFVRVKTT